MSALAFLRFYSQAPACQLCVLVLATGTLAWCIKRHFLKTEGSTMASSGRNTTQNDAGPSSEPSATSRKRTYADVLKSTNLHESRIRIQQIHRSLNASLQAPPPPPHFQLSRESESAAHQVFRTPELLGMILSNLHLVSNRNAMRVSKQFWAVWNPNAERHLGGIKQALGLEFSRSIESLTESEKGDLWIHNYYLSQIPEPRLDWLVNFELDLSYVYHRHAPFLKVWPFVLQGKTGSLKHRRLEISLMLDAEDIDKEYTESKGVYACRRGSRDLAKLYERDCEARNWMYVKLLNVPFKVMVSVGVDFRKVMGAPTHHEGVCNVPGCVVGLHGVQRTMTTLQPEKATMGELIAFLDLVEHDARKVAATIARRSLRHGYGPRGEPYYLGSSVSPPRLALEYTGDYTIDASQYQPSRLTLEQMTPRSLREVLFPEESAPK